MLIAPRLTPIALKGPAESLANLDAWPAAARGESRLGANAAATARPALIFRPRPRRVLQRARNSADGLHQCHPLILERRLELLDLAKRSRPHDKHGRSHEQNK